MSTDALTEPTRSAHWGWDEHRYFGHAVFAELTGVESLSGLLALSIIGRRLTPEESAVLDDAAAALTLADPRIWPLKLTRAVAAYGAFTPALAAGVLMQHEARIGPWAFLEAAKALVALHAELTDVSAAPARAHEVLAAFLAKRRFVWGFGTPFRSRDERLVAFRRCVERRGRHELPYWRTMEALARTVRAERHAEPNISIALAAILLDMGVEPAQVGAFAVALMQHMFFAHAVEAAASPATPLRELPAERVSFAGTAPRLSPRALAAGAPSPTSSHPK